MINSLCVTGRVTTEPELKEVAIKNDSAPVTTFKFACDTRQESTIMVTISAWRRLAKLTHYFLKAGSRVCITGTLTMSTYNKKVGDEVVTYPSLGIELSQFEVIANAKHQESSHEKS